MSKTEILEKLNALKSETDAKAIQKELRPITSEFYALYNKEQKDLEEKQLDLDTEIEIDVENDQLNNDIIASIESCKDRIAELKKAADEAEKENLNAKQILIKRFQLLLQNEENIGVLFNTIKEIREEWNAIGNIPKAKFQDIQAQYSQLNELFNYNVNIYKELQENDLKKNYSLKNQIIHQAKELLGEKNLKTLDQQVKALQNQWEEVGPTFQEHWEQLKEEYWSTIKAIYDKINELREAREKEKAENLVKKQQLIEEVKNFAATIPDTHAAWEKATQAMNAFQESWKKIGFAPKEVNDKIWTEFRGYFDAFYAAKAKFYEKRKEGNEEKKTLKEEIIKKADQLKEITDWKAGTDLAIKLQNEWKKVGHAGQYAEQKLWKEFRSRCDDFFAKKDAYYKELDAANEGNLKLKQAIIEEIKAFEGSDNAKENIEALKGFSSRFAEIGNVPYKQKDAIYKEYKTALDAQYDKLKLSGKEKDKVFFQAKLDSIKGAADPSRMFQKEKDFLRKKINELTKEVTNYENNLGFFGNSKGAEALLKGVMANIEKGKSEIDALKQKMREITKLEKEV